MKAIMLGLIAETAIHCGAGRSANHLHARALIEEFLGLQRLLGADVATAAMIAAIAVEEILMALGAVTAAIAVSD